MAVAAAVYIYIEFVTSDTEELIFFIVIGVLDDKTIKGIYILHIWGIV